MRSGRCWSPTNLVTLALDYFRLGRDMIQHAGANGYHVMNRLGHLLKTRRPSSIDDGALQTLVLHGDARLAARERRLRPSALLRDLSPSSKLRGPLPVLSAIRRGSGAGPSRAGFSMRLPVQSRTERASAGARGVDGVGRAQSPPRPFSRVSSERDFWEKVRRSRLGSCRAGPQGRCRLARNDGWRAARPDHRPLVEAVHYLPGDPPDTVGWKLAAVQSVRPCRQGRDYPRACLLNYALAGDADLGTSAFLDGLQRALDDYAMAAGRRGHGRAAGRRAGCAFPHRDRRRARRPARGRIVPGLSRATSFISAARSATPVPGSIFSAPGQTEPASLIAAYRTPWPDLVQGQMLATTRPCRDGRFRTAC